MIQVNNLYLKVKSVYNNICRLEVYEKNNNDYTLLKYIERSVYKKDGRSFIKYNGERVYIDNDNSNIILKKIELILNVVKNSNMVGAEKLQIALLAGDIEELLVNK